MQDQRLEWLRPKMDELFEKKEKYEAKGKNFNTMIQGLREYRNPRICEKLIEKFNIKQYGSNFPKDQFDPSVWAKEAYYDSSRYQRLLDRREREKSSKHQHQHQQQQQHHHHHH